MSNLHPTVGGHAESADLAIAAAAAASNCPLYDYTAHIAARSLEQMPIRYKSVYCPRKPKTPGDW